MFPLLLAIVSLVGRIAWDSSKERVQNERWENKDDVVNRDILNGLNRVEGSLSNQLLLLKEIERGLDSLREDHRSILQGFGSLNYKLGFHQGEHGKLLCDPGDLIQRDGVQEKVGKKELTWVGILSS